MDRLKDLEVRYYDALDQFKQLNLALVENGQAGLAVVLSHELFRFLYPSEPHASFTHTDPVAFAVDHIHKLNVLAETAHSTIRGYNFDLATLVEQDSEPVETKTSDFYSDLWAKFDRAALTEESSRLLQRRLPAAVIDARIGGKKVLDMGCGSGRYSIALAALGASEVVAVDYQAKAFRRAETYANEADLPITFREADVLNLPFADRSFDFVFSNGVLHHTRDWARGLAEYARVMKTSGYLYTYACGGIFWNSRDVMRDIFKRIPRDYAMRMLHLIGLPANRFIFMDAWYVPIELHLKKADLIVEFDRHGLAYESVPSLATFDPAYGLSLGIPGAGIMWGEGEHRFLLTR